MGPGTVLVVEDDAAIRETLALALEDEGYHVIGCASAEDGLVAARGGEVRVMLVDLTLGGRLDGFELIRQVRAFSDAPIIVVSARADTHDIVAALEGGADDYVTKPFQVKEIGARLRALMRRGRILAPGTDEAATTAVVLDGRPPAPLVLHPDAGVVRRGDDQVPLTLTEYRLLCELASPPGKVRSRQVLLERVWDHGFFGDERIVDVHIRRLRTKVELDPSAPRTVVTVRGLGYRLDLA